MTYDTVACQRVFGFREREEARLNWPGGGMTWFEVGNSLFSIATPDEMWRKKPDTPGLVMKVYVDDIDEHFARAKAGGAKIVSEPANGFWGGRTYRALDHEGHQWEISQRGRDHERHLPSAEPKFISFAEVVEERFERGADVLVFHDRASFAIF